MRPKDYSTNKQAAIAEVAILKRATVIQNRGRHLTASLGSARGRPIASFSGTMDA